MDKAPDLKELGKTAATVQRPPKKEKPTMPKAQQKKPSPKPAKQHMPSVLPFRVYGVGGAGRLAANRFASRHEGHDIMTIDTTLALTKTVAGVQAVRINRLKGSGKIRESNHAEIETWINERIDSNGFKEVGIIICSLSGGSGSVICPKLVSRIIEAGKIAIVIAIADTNSEVDANNCMNTLIDLDTIAKEREAYLPFVLFSNEHGRGTVDNGVDIVIDRLTRLLHTRFFGSDPSDRENFLQPHRTNPNVKPGVKLLNLSGEDDGDWDCDLGLVISEQNVVKIDSTIIISAINVELSRGILPAVTYSGYFDDDNETALVGSLGYSIPQKFMTYLNNEIHMYQKATTDEDTYIGFADPDIDDEY